MGDHRARIKVEFSMYGRTEEWSASINWTPETGEADGVDRRVTDWYRKAALRMREQHETQSLLERERNRRAREREAELEHLKMLLQKYPDVARRGGP